VGISPSAWADNGPHVSMPCPRYSLYSPGGVSVIAFMIPHYCTSTPFCVCSNLLSFLATSFPPCVVRGSLTMVTFVSPGTDIVGVGDVTASAGAVGAQRKPRWSPTALGSR
jgi:hypothetical protein